MGPKVFVSYATEDAPIAEAVCQELEGAGVECWIAPRDVEPGTNYGRAIVDAIATAPLVVLVLSEASNVSPHVRNELVQAISHDVDVLPFRVTDVAPSPDIALFLGPAHWLDAFTGPLEAGLEALVETCTRRLGVPEPSVAVPSLQWPGIPLPEPLALADRYGFVGREEALAALNDAWHAACMGKRTTVLISGEPGIGKTALIRHFAQGAQADGATVLFGRCDEDAGIPFEPFAVALRDFMLACPRTHLRLHMGALSGELTRLVPQLVALCPALPAPHGQDPEMERFRLFEAVAEFLRSMGTRAPVLLVVDDLQWADKPTVALLRHLVNASPQGRLLIAGTYRETDVEPVAPLRTVIADLARRQDAVQVRLEGLEATDTGSLVDVALGRAVANHRITAALQQDTRGNPFFVTEMLAHLAHTGGAEGHTETWTDLQTVDIPPTVMDLVAQRIEHLGPLTRSVLEAAAVIGSLFEAQVLAAVVRHDDEAFAALDDAESAGLLHVLQDGARYEFSNAIVRAALVRRLPATRRLRLHLSIGKALTGRPDAEAHLDEIAFHLCAAAALGDPRQALSFARRAGEQALSALAFETAAGNFEHALQMLTLLQGDQATTVRCDLQTALGTALRAAGDPRHRQVLFDAAATARKLGDAGRLARGALALNVLAEPTSLAVTDAPVVDLFAESLEKIGNTDPETRALLLAALAVELLHSPEWERRLTLSREAIDLARGLQSPATLARVLITLHWATATPDNLDERLANDVELIDMAATLDDPSVACWAQLIHYENLIEAGDVDSADAALDQADRLLPLLHQPLYDYEVSIRRAEQALLAGRLEQSEQLISAAWEIGLSGAAPPSVATYNYGDQLAFLRFEQGRLEELIPTFEGMVTEAPTFTAARAGLALAHCAAGDLGRARPHFELIAANDFADVSGGHLWLSVMLWTGMIASDLRDRTRAWTLYRRLCPYAGRIGHTGVTADGPVDLVLGMLAVVIGRTDQAEEHFAASRDRCTVMRAPTFLARTHLFWAEMLSPLEGATSSAREHAEEAARIAEELGQHHVHRRALELLETPGQTGERRP